MLLWFGGAVLVTVGAWLGYCAAVGSLRALWANTVLFNRGYRLLGAEISGIAAAAHEALAIALEHREVLAPLILVPLAIPYTGRQAVRVPLAWLVSGLGMFVVQGKFFSMHYYSVLAPLALLSAIVWCAVATRVREHRPWRQRATWIAALLLSLAAGYRTAFTWEHSAAAALRATESAAGVDLARARCRALQEPDGIGRQLAERARHEIQQGAVMLFRENTGGRHQCGLRSCLNSEGHGGGGDHGFA